MKKFLKILLRILIVFIVLIVLLAAVAFGYFYYTRWSKDRTEIITYSGDKRIITSTKIELEPKINCLFLGVNNSLTDFIMLGQYDPNTREVNLMSIPRDTKVSGTIDGKINSAYAGVDPMRTVNKVTELTGVEIQYYVLFKTKVLRDLVDAVDGVTVDVPFNMNYEDPYQDLYIHLKKGTQKLDGKKAEQFVRYRSGYVEGDVGRIRTQQQFIKAMIGRCLEPQNLIKVGTLVNIVLDNTKTNITQEIAAQYIDDAVAFKSDRVRIETLPGEGRYASNGISYFFMDEVKGKELIDELFNQETDIEEVKEMLAQEELESGSFGEAEIRHFSSGDEVKIEVLNNGTSTKNFNAVVELLNNSGYTVVRVGNTNDEDNKSRIAVHVASQDALAVLQDLSKLVGISHLETDYSGSSEVEFTIVLGPKYSL